MDQHTTFGVEVEFVGATMIAVAGAVAAAVRGTRAPRGTTVRAPDGRVWSVVSDASLSSRGTRYGGEVVTPILKGDADMATLQAVVRAIKAAGAAVDYSCGVHVHVGMTGANARDVYTLARNVSHVEALWSPTLNIADRRRGRFCQPTPLNAVRGLREAAANNPTAPHDAPSVMEAWYQNAGTANTPGAYSYLRTNKLSQARYYGLNLHAMFFRGAVEFRWFDGTLHAGEIRSYVALCVALVTHARAGGVLPRFIDARGSDGVRAHWRADVAGRVIARLGITDPTVSMHLLKHVRAAEAALVVTPALRVVRNAAMAA